MAQLQFRSDDTIKWLEGYGNRSNGDTTPSGTFGNQKTTFTGTEGADTGTVGSATGFAIDDLVLIHQSRNGGDGAGVWQLNKITNIVSTTFTFKYDLTNDYATTAQIIKINSDRNITINGTLNAPEWDGTTGGIIVLMGDSVTGSGTINLNGAGYRGGTSGKSQGEGHSGNGTSSTAANGSGAGGGSQGPDSGHVEGGHGGGGGNGQAGNSGSGKNTATPGTGGAQVGNAGLTVAIFGGGGGLGGSAFGGSPQGTSGADGGGLLIIIARNIDLSSMTVVRSNGNGSSGNSNSAGCGGGGAGGSILLKGITINLGTGKVTATGGVGGTSTGAFGGKGADGAVGRIHADYVSSLSGTSSPTIDSRQDATLVDPGGAFLGLI